MAILLASSAEQMQQRGVAAFQTQMCDDDRDESGFTFSKLEVKGVLRLQHVTAAGHTLHLVP